MKSFVHISLSLLAAASLCLSCGGSVETPKAQPTDEVSQLSNPADTLVFLDGLKLFQQEQYDLAREQLLKSSESDNIYIKAESFLYLNALEMELENYNTARIYLEKYHAEAIKLYNKALAAERDILIHKEEVSQSVSLMNKKLNRLVIGTIGIALLAALLFFIRRKYPRSGKKQEDGQIPSAPDISGYKHHLISAEIFKQTSIYSEITELAKQKKNRDTKILNAARQEVLNEQLGEVFKEFIGELKRTCQLTDNDIKLCCLSLLPLSTFAKSICFGSIEANIIKQRKHQIKKKMGENRDDAALFDFIFTSR